MLKQYSRQLSAVYNAMVGIIRSKVIYVFHAVRAARASPFPSTSPFIWSVYVFSFVREAAQVAARAFVKWAATPVGGAWAGFLITGVKVLICIDPCILSPAGCAGCACHSL